MTRLTLAATALLITAAAAIPTESPPAPGPEPVLVYKGCAEVDASTFPKVVDFFAPFTASQCVTACGASSHAAVGLSCVCSEPELATPKFTLVDEAKCNRVCIEGEEDSGICGGEGVWSVYAAKEDGGDDSDDEDCTTATDGPTGTATGTADPTNAPTGTKTDTDIVTVTSCPEEVEDCPYRPTPTPDVPCKGNGTCHTGKPQPPPCSTCGGDPEPTDVPVEAGAVARGVGLSAIVAGVFAFML